MKHSQVLSLLVLFCLALVPAAGASNFPGLIKLGMEPRVDELSLFGDYLGALESNPALVHLAEAGREILVAVESQDYEAYLAAKAVYGYRLETLVDGAMAELRNVEHEMLQSQPVSIPD